jgi:hypothetical protein
LVLSFSAPRIRPDGVASDIPRDKGIIMIKFNSQSPYRTVVERDGMMMNGVGYEATTTSHHRPPPSSNKNKPLMAVAFITLNSKTYMDRRIGDIFLLDIAETERAAPETTVSFSAAGGLNTSALDLYKHRID